MLRGIIKGARAQKPLVEKAWRITTTMVNPIQYPKASVQEELFPEFITAPAKEASQDYHSLGKYWLGNLFPVQRFIINPRGLFPDVYNSFVNKKLPPILTQIGEELNTEIRVLKFENYHRDGGAVVELGSRQPLEQDVVYRKIQHELDSNDFRAPLTVNPIIMHRIKGKPWINDLLYPSPYIKINLELFNKSLAQKPDLEQDLYEIFRPYGKLVSLTVEDRSMKDNKPMALKIRYKRLPSAIAARICLHDANFFDLIKEENPNETAKLIINYEQFITTNVFQSAYSKHPRSFTVLFGILLAFSTITVIDPIRKFFIWIKLNSASVSGETTKGFSSLVQYSYRLISSVGLSSLIKLPSKEIYIEIPNGAEKKLELYLKRKPDTILYLTGPTGTGKTCLAQRAASYYQPNNSLYLDFEELLQVNNEDEFIRKLCRSIGFFPSFAAMETLGSLLDAISPGAGRTATSSPQGKTQKILKTLTDVMQTMNARGSIPLIVIDGFSDTNQAKHSDFIQTILQTLDLWVHYKIARVVFVADTTFEATGGLASLIPNARVEKIAFCDLDLNDSLLLIQQKLTVKTNAEELKDAIQILGGRLGDMHAFINRVNSGTETPSQAVSSILKTAKEDIENILFEHKRTHRDFSVIQLWKTLALVATMKEVPYDYILFSIFKGDDKALRSMIQTKIFAMEESIQDKHGDIVKAGSPITQRAFEEIYGDSLIRPGMDLSVARSSVSSEETQLRAYEDELVQIRNSGLYTEPQIAQRVAFLLQKYQECQIRIESYDKVVTENTDLLKQTLSS